MELREYISTIDNAIRFALWLFDRQTPDEQYIAETIEANKIGFNSPDAKKLTLMLSAIKKGDKFDKKVLAMFYAKHLKHRLLKYKNQYKVYVSEKKIPKQAEIF